MRIFNVVLSFVCLAIVVGCARIPGTQENGIFRAKSIIISSLLDPRPAQFGRIEAFRDAGGNNYDNSINLHKFWACGSVNGKNAYGGYVGFRRFIVDIDTREIFNEPVMVMTAEEAGEKLRKCQTSYRGKKRSDINYEFSRMLCDEAGEAINQKKAEIDFLRAWSVGCDK